jgi:hypothetical protein
MLWPGELKDFHNIVVEKLGKEFESTWDKTMDEAIQQCLNKSELSEQIGERFKSNLDEIIQQYLKEKKLSEQDLSEQDRGIIKENFYRKIIREIREDFYNREFVEIQRVFLSKIKRKECKRIRNLGMEQVLIGSPDQLVSTMVNAIQRDDCFCLEMIRIIREKVSTARFIKSNYKDGLSRVFLAAIGIGGYGEYNEERRKELLKILTELRQFSGANSISSDSEEGVGRFIIKAVIIGDVEVVKKLIELFPEHMEWVAINNSLEQAVKTAVLSKKGDAVAIIKELRKIEQAKSIKAIGLTHIVEELINQKEKQDAQVRLEKLKEIHEFSNAKDVAFLESRIELLEKEIETGEKNDIEERLLEAIEKNSELTEILERCENRKGVRTKFLFIMLGKAILQEEAEHMIRSLGRCPKAEEISPDQLVDLIEKAIINREQMPGIVAALRTFPRVRDIDAEQLFSLMKKATMEIFMELRKFPEAENIGEERLSQLDKEKENGENEKGVGLMREKAVVEVEAKEKRGKKEEEEVELVGKKKEEEEIHTDEMGGKKKEMEGTGEFNDSEKGLLDAVRENNPRQFSKIMLMTGGKEVRQRSLFKILEEAVKRNDSTKIGLLIFCPAARNISSDQLVDLIEKAIINREQMPGIVAALRTFPRVRDIDAEQLFSLMEKATMEIFKELRKFPEAENIGEERLSQLDKEKKNGENEKAVAAKKIGVKESSGKEEEEEVELAKETEETKKFDDTEEELLDAVRSKNEEETLSELRGKENGESEKAVAAKKVEVKKGGGKEEEEEVELAKEKAATTEIETEKKREMEETEDLNDIEIKLLNAIKKNNPEQVLDIMLSEEREKVRQLETMLKEAVLKTEGERMIRVLRYNSSPEVHNIISPEQLVDLIELSMFNYDAGKMINTIKTFPEAKNISADQLVDLIEKAKTPEVVVVLKTFPEAKNISADQLLKLMEKQKPEIVVILGDFPKARSFRGGKKQDLAGLMRRRGLGLFEK